MQKYKLPARSILLVYSYNDSKKERPKFKTLLSAPFPQITSQDYIRKVPVIFMATFNSIYHKFCGPPT